MRFIVDAQLPRRMARWLTARGHDVLHTLDLADGNRTPDVAITERACQDDRIVEAWFDYRDKRNLTSHTYDERKAKEVFAILPRFATDAADLYSRLLERHG